MKRFLLLLAVCLFSHLIIASELVLIPTKNIDNTKYLFKNPSVTIHFYRDDFVIATIDGQPKEGIILLDQNPWKEGISYYLVYLDNSVDRLDYIRNIETIASILIDAEDFLIVSIDEKVHGQLPPAKNDGMVRIMNTRAKFPNPGISSTKTRFDVDPFVQSLLDEVSGTSITSVVQHLQNYVTRDAYNSQSIVAQQWIATQFENLGLDVEVMDFTMPGGPASDNVIATQVGTLYPDQYVVVGGHYDSRSYSGPAPGADDNASGTSAVMEIARILSEYEFDRSIIYCAFSGEEYGLYGSAAYAYRCAQEGMNILGYFNLDMIGYLQPGNTMLTTLIYPQSAQELATFYTNVTSIYLPDFVVEIGSLSGGDSDHTSFNNNGFIGIFPFENVNAYSPYIHTSNDLIGPSYNNEDQAVVFTKASLASVATLANRLAIPQNLVAIPSDGLVQLQWDPIVNAKFFNIYRDGVIVNSSSYNEYYDDDVENGTLYTYYVTAFYPTNQESDPSSSVSVTPMPPIELPLCIDFENGTPYWNLDEAWGVTSSSYYSPSHSLTESPNGNYSNNQELYATLYPINLMGYSGATLSFWTKYDIENNWDFMWLEISTNGLDWIELDEYTGTQSNWVNKSYSLEDFLWEPYVLIRFHFYSDYTITKDGMYIDDFCISVEGGFENQRVMLPEGWTGLSSNIIPFDLQVENIMAPFANKLIIIRNLEGEYWPSHDVNTLESWDVNSGYMIKSYHNGFIDFYGDINENGTVEIHEGWNLIPVLAFQSVDVVDLFEPIENMIEIVKDVANVGVYWPSEGVNTLSNLQSGKAYFVKAKEPATISFANSEPKHLPYIKYKTQDEGPWSVVIPKPNSHVLLFPSEVIQELEVGDYIGAFTPNGLCVGFLQIENINGNNVLVAYANDDLNEEIDGFINGDNILLKYYKSASSKEYNLIVEYDSNMDNQGLFANEGLSKIISLSIDYTGVISDKLPLFRVFPNPVKDLINIELNTTQPVQLEIINQIGQIIISTTIERSTQINTSNWFRGVYILRVLSGNKVETMRMVIQ